MEERYERAAMERTPQGICVTHLLSDGRFGTRVAKGFGMILLVTASSRSAECAAALNGATGQEIAVAQTLPQAAALLRREDYCAVVLDQHLLESDPKTAEAALDQIGAAIPIQVNLGISGMDRVVREVRAAMQRGEREEVRARLAVIGRLHGELNTTVTALLLSSELALATQGIPSAALEKLTTVHELVKKLRRQLEGGGSVEEVLARVHH
jgi:hypothetical protein